MMYLQACSAAQLLWGDISIQALTGPHTSQGIEEKTSRTERSSPKGHSFQHIASTKPQVAMQAI